ncbi:MAG: hypothetical protein HEQ39_00245 [Rhizobacter sp.]
MFLRQRLVYGLLPAAAACVLMLMFAASRWPLWEQAFYSDQSPAAWLSSAQLLGAALLALCLSQRRELPRLLGWWLAGALWVLALDEQFMLHEQWKFGCVQWWSACSQRWVAELPTIAVGVVGSVTVLALMRVVRDALFRSQVISGLAVGLLALLVDLAQMPTSLLPLEESLEVLAEALFIGALLAIPGASTPTRLGGHQLHSA